ncbi:hypothetical protein Tco_0176207, partial [Tanacetum coccineum]
VKEINDEKKKELNEKQNDMKCADNQNLDVNCNGRNDEYVEGIIDKDDNMNIHEGDELRNVKECLAKEIKVGVEGSGNKNEVNGSATVSEKYVNDNADILFGMVSSLDALNADKIDFMLLILKLS